MLTSRVCYRCFVLALLLNEVAPSTFDVTKFGAVGDGITDDTKSIESAIRAAGATTGNSVVLFPAGKEFITGPLNMTSRMTLQVDGTLKAKSGNVTADGILVRFFPADCFCDIHLTSLIWLILQRFFVIDFIGMATNPTTTELWKQQRQPLFAVSGVYLRPHCCQSCHKWKRCD